MQTIKQHPATGYQIVKGVAEYAALADAYEAMTAQRFYKETKNKEDAIPELEKCAGRQFDPEIVKVFVEKVLDRT